MRGVFFAYLFALQLVSSTAAWVAVRDFIPPLEGAATELRGKYIPRRIVCREVQFDSPGTDALVEASFVLVVSVEIDRSGEVQRFRVERQPPVGTDLSGALRVALQSWRYVVPPAVPGETIRFPVALQKARGASATQACD